MWFRVLGLLMVSLSFGVSMGANDVEQASKEELGCIKNLGKKRVEAIVAYRDKNELESVDELKRIKGIGEKTIENIKEGKKKKVCTSFTKPSAKEKKGRRKEIKAE